MTDIDWLKQYYGEAYEELSPQTVMENDSFAVVRIVSTTNHPGFSNSALMLVKKSENYKNARKIAVGEGALTPDLEAKIRTIFENAELFF